MCALLLLFCFVEQLSHSLWLPAPHTPQNLQPIRCYTNQVWHNQKKLQLFPIKEALFVHSCVAFRLDCSLRYHIFSYHSVIWKKKKKKPGSTLSLQSSLPHYKWRVSSVAQATRAWARRALQEIKTHYSTGVWLRIHSYARLRTERLGSSLQENTTSLFSCNARSTLVSAFFCFCSHKDEKQKHTIQNVMYIYLLSYLLWSCVLFAWSSFRMCLGSNWSEEVENKCGVPLGITRMDVTSRLRNVHLIVKPESIFFVWINT